LAAYWVLILLAVEYYKRPTKARAAIVGLSLGGLTFILNPSGIIALSVFYSSLLGRLAWYILFERISRKALLLFIIKMAVIVVVSLGLYMLLQSNWRSSVLLSPYPVNPPTISMWVLVGVVLIASRGLWATLLIQTKRSPALRSLRIYLIVFGSCLWGVSWFLRAHAVRIFTPYALNAIDRSGLSNNSILTMLFMLYGTLLLMNAGVDRSLFKDSRFGRRLRLAITQDFEQQLS